MTEFKITAVKDKIMGELLQPVFVHTEEEAKRLFNYQLRSNPIWKENPEQFELYNLGIFDSHTGNIIGVDENHFTSIPATIHPELICKGTDILTKGE